MLVAPLDWGLGHATRCIPVIKELLNQKCVVIIAASGAQKALLSAEFPSLTITEIPGYEVKYGKNRALTVFRLIFSIPKILIRVKQEKAWLRRFCAREKPDLVISDNRYGLYAPGVPSVFITHQLLIRTPFGPLADRLVQWMNYVAIRPFSRCWVPDEQDQRAALAGDLSHPHRKPVVPVRYVGWLSRFGAMVPPPTAPVFPAPDLLVLLSGPEPQRSLLERTILDQSAGLDARIVLVRGLPGGPASGHDQPKPSGLSSTPQVSTPLSSIPTLLPNIEVFNHLPAAELERFIRGAALVLARAGYSTVMDLGRLGKKAILVPTPGQTEQEYLGNYLAKKGWAFCMDQRGFSLADALSLAQGQPVHHPGPETAGLLAAAVKEALKLAQSFSVALG